MFSLATGLERASGQSSLETVGMAKQASVLFDEVIIESGLHVVEMTSARQPTVMRRGRESLSRALLSDARVVRPGTKTGIAVRRHDEHVELYVGTDLPRFQEAYYAEHEVAYRYLSEHHTGVLDELAALRADWVRVVAVDATGEEPAIRDDPLTVLPSEANDLVLMLELDTDQARELGEALASPFNAPAGVDESETESVSAAQDPEDSLLATNLAEAVRLADRMDAIPALTSAFTKVAKERGVPVGLPGAESLGLVVPNFSVLPWEAIARFRDHPGAVEARERLSEFEAEAAAREPPGSAEFVRQTGRAVTKGLLATVRDLAPSLPDELRGPVTGSAMGLVPIVGQYASLAISMGDVISALRRSQEYEGSWMAAVFELRDAAAEAVIDW